MEVNAILAGCVGVLAVTGSIGGAWLAVTNAIERASSKTITSVKENVGLLMDARLAEHRVQMMKDINGTYVRSEEMRTIRDWIAAAERRFVELEREQ